MGETDRGCSRSASKPLNSFILFFFRKDMRDLPSRANGVIVGGGIVGCSVAYHLMLRGCADVVLLERRA